MTVSDAQLKEVKDRLHITHDSEDENLKRLISASHAAIKGSCGEFELDAEELGKELVYERVRYAYNDAVEYFEDNFLSQIVAFNFHLYTKAEEARLLEEETATDEGGA